MVGQELRVVLGRLQGGCQRGDDRRQDQPGADDEPAETGHEAAERSKHGGNAFVSQGPRSTDFGRDSPEPGVGWLWHSLAVSASFITGTLVPSVPTPAGSAHRARGRTTNSSTHRISLERGGRHRVGSTSSRSRTASSSSPSRPSRPPPPAWSFPTPRRRSPRRARSSPSAPAASMTTATASRSTSPWATSVIYSKYGGTEVKYAASASTSSSPPATFSRSSPDLRVSNRPGRHAHRSPRRPGRMTAAGGFRLPHQGRNTVPKILEFDEHARRALERGVDKLANTVKVTLGPKRPLRRPRQEVGRADHHQRRRDRRA